MREHAAYKKNTAVRQQEPPAAPKGARRSVIKTSSPLNAGLARDIAKLASRGGIPAVCAAVELFGRTSGFQEELQTHFRKCAEAELDALALVGGAQ
jgi:hypothetical protein